MALWTVKRSQLCRGTVLGDESDLFSRIFLIKVLKDINGAKRRKNNLVEKIKGFPLKVKSFRKIATNKKLLGRGSINSLPHSGGMALPVRPRVKV